MKPTAQSGRELPTPSRSRTCLGFTLMELLTVVAIILVLAGLLFAALRGARRAAKEGVAKVQINQLSAAFRAYYNEYGQWPDSPWNGTNWIGILTANNTTWNPRKIVFMEFKSSETNIYGMCDPWGSKTPKNVYYFGFDTNYDNQIDRYSDTNNPPAASTTTPPAGAKTNTMFVIWSLGDPQNTPLKTIGSWQ